MATTRYKVPASTLRVEEEIRHSRFITTIAPAATVEDATAFIRRVGEEFPDATHNCWAYLVGPPGTSARIGMSDDGEPHGTAGRPMLAALQHGGVGDVAVVVTRYFGGTKLGTGGLVRAYSGGVQRALAALATRDRVEWIEVEITAGYAHVTALQQLFPVFEVDVSSQDFGTVVRVLVRMPKERLEDFRAAALDATRGQAVLVER